MVHICNFYPGKVFNNNLFLMFHRFGNDITVYVLYDGISKNYSCRSFRFGGCRFFGSYLDWTRSLFWGWPAEWLIEFSCLLCWFSLSFISLSSSILKRLRDAKLLRSLLSDVLNFAGFLVWRIFQFGYYRYYFYFGNILNDSVFAMEFIF